MPALFSCFLCRVRGEEGLQSRFPKQRSCRGARSTKLSGEGHGDGGGGGGRFQLEFWLQRGSFDEELNLNSHLAAGMWARPGRESDQNKASELPAAAPHQARPSAEHQVVPTQLRSRGWHQPGAAPSSWSQTRQILPPEGRLPCSLPGSICVKSWMGTVQNASQQGGTSDGHFLLSR